MLKPFHTLFLIMLLVIAGCSPDETPSPDSPENSAPSDITDVDDNWEPSCAEDLLHFQEQLWEPMLSFQCISCHTSGSIADHTRMVLVDGHIQHNFETLWSLAQVDEAGGPKLLLHPSGQGADPHTGGDLIEPGSSQYQAMEYWIARARDEVPCVDIDAPEPEAESMQPGPRLLRRLSHHEYKNTVTALFPYAAELELNFAPDNVVEDFSNNADALVVSPLLGDQYREAAETLGQFFAQNIDQHLSCLPEEIGPAACVSELLSTFATKIFRRPLTTEEAQHYFDLWLSLASEDGYLTGVQWMVTAMLQSPHFLYRSELGRWQASGHYALSAYELATELAYNLTGYPPDQELYNTASNGTLLSEDVVLAQANRLMQTQHGTHQFWEFMQAWLGLEQLHQVTRSPEIYPELTPSIRDSMLEQTKRLTQEVFENGSLNQLFDNPYTYLNEELAQYYGVVIDSTAIGTDGYARVSQNEKYRGGLLTEGSFLTTYAKANSSSPIHRGILIREKLFCQHLPPPPANLDTSPPEMDLSKSTRERYIEHAQNPACNGCHSMIDPIGFAFEHFDGIGRYRELDGVHPIDDQGEIVHTTQTNGLVDGSQGLSSALAQSKDVQNCFTQQWLRYTYGLHDEALLETTQSQLSENFAAQEGHLQSGLLSMVQTPHFRLRAEDPDLLGSELPEPETTWNPESLLAGRSEPEVHQGTGAPTPVGLSVDISEASRWNTGACFDVAVGNNSEESLTWQIEIPLEGTLENIWSAEISENGVNSLIVHGLSWNATLAPAASTTFGYCVSF